MNNPQTRKTPNYTRPSALARVAAGRAPSRLATDARRESRRGHTLYSTVNSMSMSMHVRMSHVCARACSGSIASHTRHRSQSRAPSFYISYHSRNSRNSGPHRDDTEHHERNPAPPPPHARCWCWCCVCGECADSFAHSAAGPATQPQPSPHRPAGCSVRVARASWRTRFTPPSHQAPCIETPPTHHTYSPRSPPHRTLRQRPTDRGLFVRTEVWRPLPLPWPGLQPSSTSSRGAPTGPGAATLRLEVRLELPYSRSSSPQTPLREAAATRVLFLL